MYVRSIDGMVFKAEDVNGMIREARDEVVDAWRTELVAKGQKVPKVTPLDVAAEAKAAGEAAAAALGWQGTPGSHSSLFAQLVFLCYAYAKRVEPFKIFFPHR